MRLKKAGVGWYVSPPLGPQTYPWLRGVFRELIHFSMTVKVYIPMPLSQSWISLAKGGNERCDGIRVVNLVAPCLNCRHTLFKSVITRHNEYDVTIPPIVDDDQIRLRQSCLQGKVTRTGMIFVTPRTSELFADQ